MPPKGAPGAAAELRRVRDRIVTLTDTARRLRARASQLEATASRRDGPMADHFRRQAVLARQNANLCDAERASHEASIPGLIRRLNLYNYACAGAVLLLVILTFLL